MVDEYLLTKTVLFTVQVYMLENTEEAIKNGQSRETGNIGYTKQRKTQRNWQQSF
jgi:hypothetical protein